MANSIAHTRTPMQGVSNQVSTPSLMCCPQQHSPLSPYTPLLHSHALRPSFPHLGPLLPSVPCLGPSIPCLGPSIPCLVPSLPHLVPSLPSTLHPSFPHLGPSLLHSHVPCPSFLHLGPSLLLPCSLLCPSPPFPSPGPCLHPFLFPFPHTCGPL